MAKITAPPVVVPKGTGWYKLCTGIALVQNIDEEPVYFVLNDNEPAIRDANTCHKFRHETDDNYVNDLGDTIWVLKNRNKEYRLAVSTNAGDITAVVY